MMVTMLSGFAEFERALIAERTRGALARKKELGFVTGIHALRLEAARRLALARPQGPGAQAALPARAGAGLIRLVHGLWAEAVAKQQGGMTKRKAKGSCGRSPPSSTRAASAPARVSRGCPPRSRAC